MSAGRRHRRLPPIPQGEVRAWVICRECARAAFYTYIPFAVSGGIRTLPCGHGAAVRWTEATRSVTYKQAHARRAIRRRLAGTRP